MRVTIIGAGNMGRGVGTLKALGSVSERIAHEASCSVLLVRGARPS